MLAQLLIDLRSVYFTAVYKSLDCLGVENSVATAIQYGFLILYEMGKFQLYKYTNPMQMSYSTPSGILGLNLVAFRRMKRHNPPGPLITTLCRDGIMYVAAIVGKRYSHRALQWSMIPMT